MLDFARWLDSTFPASSRQVMLHHHFLRNVNNFFCADSSAPLQDHIQRGHEPWGQTLASVAPRFQDRFWPARLCRPIRHDNTYGVGAR